MKLLLLFSIAAAALLAQSKSADEAAVREVVRKYVDARDHPDARALEALFTADADQLVSSGQWRKGHDEVVRGTIASSQNETGKRTITVESVRFLAPGVALADGRYEIGDRKMWTTLLITQAPSGWKIAAIRNMLPAK
jgi:uncharacterized protein (TIGR02246 family)